MLIALDFMNDSPKQIAIVAPHGNREAAQGLLAKFGGVFLPNRVLAVVCEGEELSQAGEIIPFLNGKSADGDRAVAYVCENKNCRLPTSDPDEFERELKRAAST
jgi:hypothetical protein